MCGRYTLSTPTDLLRELYELESAVELQPRFNIAPTQNAPVIRLDGDRQVRHLDLLRWGLIPFWAKDLSIGHRMINARAETVAEKPAYRVSFRKRRCLVIADGFYEWQATGGPKQPYFFHRGDGEPFLMAGLWDRWEKGEGSPVESFTILTTDANEIVAPIHQRMPVVLDEASYENWLDPGLDDTELLSRLLVPAPTRLFVSVPVSTYVNSPANEGPRCVEPLA
jgi:putative SOS response-associated peptidase YedK